MCLLFTREGLIYFLVIHVLINRSLIFPNVPFLFLARWLDKILDLDRNETTGFYLSHLFSLEK